MTRSLICLSLAVLAIAAPGTTLAAESYDNCTGFIDALPATVSTQGTWCLRGNKFTSQTTGAAITIAGDNITIDCNDFRVSGLGAGAATEAVGVSAGGSRLNATVRNCRVQGFKRGVVLFGAGHVVEDSHFDMNTFTGIYVTGDSIVRGNFVTDTGGRPNEVFADGIIALGSAAALAGVQVLDNSIRGVAPVGDGGGNRQAAGIRATYGLVQGNRIDGLLSGGSQTSRGITLGVRGIARDNLVSQPSALAGVGILGSGDTAILCQDNSVQGFGDAILACQLAGDNGVQP